MKRKMMLFMALVLCTLPLGACVSSSSHNALKAQVSQMSRQVSTSQSNQADNWAQINELRQEMAELRGQMEVIRNGMQKVGGADKMGTLLASHDRALHLLQSQMGMDLQMDAPAVPAEQGISGDAPVASAIPVTAVAPQPPVAQPAAPVVQPAVQPQKADAGKADVAQALYDNGMNNFNAKNYSAAVKSFSDFTKTYPKHKKISEAWYWLGESNYQLKDYVPAVFSYNEVIKGYPNSQKAPAAYLKQGMAFHKLGKNSAAKERLNQLIKKYPKAPQVTQAKQYISQNKL